MGEEKEAIEMKKGRFIPVRLGQGKKGRLSFSQREFGFRTRVYHWMSKEHGLRFTNRFYGLFSSVFAAMTRGWTRPLFNQPTEQIFQRALKAKNIKRVAKVGPGADSMLLQMAYNFR